MTPNSIRKLLQQFIDKGISLADFVATLDHEIAKAAQKNETIPYRVSGLVDEARRLLSGDSAEHWAFPTEEIVIGIARETLDYLPTTDELPSREEIVESLRGLRPTMEAKYGVRFLGLVGSLARGKANVYSDIDIICEDLGGNSPWRIFSCDDELKDFFQRPVDTIFLDGMPILKRQMFEKDLVPI